MALVWLKRLFKKEEPPARNDNTKDQKTRAVKEFLANLEANWQNIEDVLFWKDARISCGLYAAVTVIFWKLITWRLQRLALLACLVSAVCVSEDVRHQAQIKFKFALKKERRKLRVTYNDVVAFVVDSWMHIEMWYEYLMKMKSESDSKFAAAVGVLVAVPFTILLYVPIIQVFFLAASMLYFWPILNYLGAMDVVIAKLNKLCQPVITHWKHSRTKRKRNQGRQLSPYRRRYSHDSDVEFSLNKPASALDSECSTQESQHDSEDEEFIPTHNVELAETELQDDSTPSDVDEFLPTDTIHFPSEMPSMSQFDSLMEPLDDEFYGGLDFARVTSRSAMPTVYSDDTDEDVEDIPFDAQASKVLHRRTHPIKKKNKVKTYEHPANCSTPNICPDPTTGQPGAYMANDEQEYEFLDQSELDEYTSDDEQEKAGKFGMPRDLIEGVVGYSKAGAEAMSAGASAVTALLGYNNGKTKND